MVGNDVDNQFDACFVQRRGHLVEVCQGAQPGVHIAVVVDVVPSVRKRGGIEGAEPYGVDAQLPQVGHLGRDTGQVAQSVPVAVMETARVDLVDGGLAPPVVGRGKLAGLLPRVG
ncbi:hypothetical protein D9M72_474910 [compost metagenome]